VVVKMTDTQALLDVINDKGLKLTFIAKKIGLSRYSLYNKIHNKSYFNAAEIQALCKVLDIKSTVTKDKLFFKG
jgi:DNA-binding phage protein